MRHMGIGEPVVEAPVARVCHRAAAAGIRAAITKINCSLHVERAAERVDAQEAHTA